MKVVTRNIVKAFTMKWSVHRLGGRPWGSNPGAAVIFVVFVPTSQLIRLRCDPYYNVGGMSPTNLFFIIRNKSMLMT
jgi:hypothetical protein